MQTLSSRHPADAERRNGAYEWESWPDEQLLSTRIRDLNLHLTGSEVEPRIERLYAELDARNLTFAPRCYLATEWLCPDRVPLIGVPFCLANRRLFALEKSMMLEVEGGSEKSFMQLIRHETGHAINYAYRLYRRTRWRELFGPISMEYNVQEYYARPYSRQFVEHLPDNYAQSHPEEDFAETFAVWLTPGLDWRRRYRGWKALKKLEYVDHLMSDLAGRRPEVVTGEKLWPVSRVRSTLANYYRKKRREFGDGYPGYYDDLLKRLFSPEPGAKNQRASAFLRRRRPHLVKQISAWGHLRKYEIDNVLRRMCQRAEELDLYVQDDDHEGAMKLGICLTSMLCEQRNRRRELAT